ncbi:MAG: PEFG-CTERM sorting domain-containing protein [Nitrosopumilus sp.]|nr:PEFG-CTERM sorting domain-containing protein [Nitrosopumilus sp.]
MKTRNSLFLLSTIFFGLIFGITSTISDDVFAQTGVNVGVETEAEIKVGEKSGEDEKSDVSVESKTQSSAEAKAQTSSENKSEEKTSETSAKGESQVQLTIKPTYPKIKASSENSFAIQSKQNLYQPGDRVKVEGSLYSSLVAQLEGANMINVQIFDNSGMMIKEDTVEMKSDGSFDGEVLLPSNSANGKYTIKSKVLADSSVLGSLSAQTKANLESTTSVIVSTPSAVKIKVEGHDDFEVKVASNSNVSDVKFKESEKKVSFVVEGETGTKGVTQVSIPKALLSGQMTVMIDGKVMASDDVIVTADSETTTTLELNYNHSVHTIDVIGTNAVPEFGTIAMIILIVAISGTILMSSKFKSLKITGY